MPADGAGNFRPFLSSSCWCSPAVFVFSRSGGSTSDTLTPDINLAASELSWCPVHHKDDSIGLIRYHHHGDPSCSTTLLRNSNRLHHSWLAPIINTPPAKQDLILLLQMIRDQWWSFSLMNSKPADTNPQTHSKKHRQPIHRDPAAANVRSRGHGNMSDNAYEKQPASPIPWDHRYHHEVDRKENRIRLFLKLQSTKSATKTQQKLDRKWKIFLSIFFEEWMRTGQ